MLLPLLLNNLLQPAAGGSANASASQTLPQVSQSATASVFAVASASQQLAAFAATQSAIALARSQASQTLAAVSQSASSAAVASAGAAQQLAAFGAAQAAIAVAKASAAQTIAAVAQVATVTVTAGQTWIATPTERRYSAAALLRADHAPARGRTWVQPALDRSETV